ncbi:dTDP-4-amino-4,6-dideoxygalactose transaminase [Rhodocytophaga rosea]|uniref:dTDP-4-amino-4,6-dideoxygalactose transaminase n=1 Tax=Rhodocytophaga rosea TaxID=2704465 RepID=A0A6C0GCE0_9BACT|nr:dTDP-4-amino-4,6-dideoxygalactose transaminase [Rhodocytophaga rosea]QHT65625.1 dTDP-4-amino-4,6-dideoxygalactose transaminase [Rhodocytophaga rosea]
MIGFNKPYFTGKETEYIIQAVTHEKISGNGLFTRKCHDFFQKRYDFNKVLLTTSCTTALEMAAILIDTQPGDEIIIPSYTFVSTANAFVLRGATIVFADSSAQNPNIDASDLEKLITSKTKAIVVVHYAGIACDMAAVMKLAERYNLFVVEDAAQAIDSYFEDKPLGSIGHLGCFSFHETKNVIAGEGGMLVINDKRFAERAEIIWEKGTNRSAFFRGEVDKYTWMDVGSSFLPSDMIAAFLYAQLENIDDIQNRRKEIWNNYHEALLPLSEENLLLPYIPAYATNNAHMFYLVCSNLEERTALINYLKQKGVHAIFHYLSLHKSAFFQSKYSGHALDQADRYSDCLVRLPFYYELSQSQIRQVTEAVSSYFARKTQISLSL